MRTAGQKSKGMEVLGRSREELRALSAEMGVPAYRGDQLYRALYAERIFDLALVTNLPVAFREKLAKETTVTLPTVRQRYQSAHRSKRCSCRARHGKRFVFRRRRAVRWIANSA